MEKLTVQEIVNAVSGKLLDGSEQTIVTNICIDSRDVGEGSLFVPMIGERVDAISLSDRSLKTVRQPY